MQKLLSGGTEPKSINIRIRELYESEGGQCTVRQLRELIIARGVLTDEERDRFIARGLDAQIAKALKVRDERGLPYAAGTQKNDDGQDVWIQRRWWSVDDYRTYCAEQGQQRDECQRMIDLARDECMERHGIDPTA